uniref:Uncharacterized protein n=1 Tax=Arundo donax TaxID=35708 RepID=A0A0A9HS51_ARUDO
MPVASPRRHPISSSAHSGGAPSPSSLSSPDAARSLCRVDGVGDGCSAAAERSSCR